MYLQRGDIRPPSMLDSGGVSPRMLIGGALFTVVAHVAVPLGIVLATSALAATMAKGNDEPQTFIEEHVVEARFVRLGKKRDPTKLPDRIVPRKSTAPDLSTVVSKNMNPEKPDKPDAGPRPDQPEEDPLLRLGDRAKAFAEIAQAREQEGDPEGIAEGTETEAQIGDLYAGKLYAFFKRNWTIPNTIADPTKFVAMADVEIRTDLTIGAFHVVQSSGDAVFDQSIEDVLQRIATEHLTVPEPPPEVADRFLGKTMGVRFKGK
jgi:hypothetical protein